MAEILQIRITQFVDTNKILLLAVLLTLVAALPRFYQLGDLSFYMDEETTAFASKSMAEGNGPQMPSGMPYHRSLPYTWLNSISIDIFGADKEYSYRLPSVLFGILTVPLLFLLARPYVGTSVAFAAALLLALSEWHIITSRQARMYAPFLFMYIACAFALLRWAQQDSLYHLVIAAILFIATASLHNMGVFLAFIPLITLFIRNFAETPQHKLIIFSVISGVCAYLYGQIIVEAPYTEWKNTNGLMLPGTKTDSNYIDLLQDNIIVVASGIVGTMLGILLAIKSSVEDTDHGHQFRTLARYVLASIVGCAATTGHLHGASLSILLLLYLYPYSVHDYLKATYKPLIAISFLAALGAIYTVAKLGFHDGVRSLLTFPYPNWIVMNEISTGVTFLFIALIVYLAVVPKSRDNNNISVLLITGLFPIILVGLVKKWAPARYLLVAYPFMLISCAYALQEVIKFLHSRFNSSRRIPAPLIPVLIIITGILGGHGLIHAYKTGTADHGTRLNRSALIFPFYPDHKHPGEFVSANRAPGDIVIAEDVLVQRWYAGNVDYWLRKYTSTGGSFVYRGEDQLFHDIYVDSIVATDEILESISNNADTKVWLITSGETYSERERYLRPEQLAWLEDIESTHTPVFTGKDNFTQVYCLNCSTNL